MRKRQKIMTKSPANFTLISKKLAKVVSFIS
jgi:hypothetical protein